MQRNVASAGFRGGGGRAYTSGVAVLVFEEGPARGAVFDLPVGREVALGREVGCDVLVDDPHASRRHALIRPAAPAEGAAAGAGGLVLEDLGSRNGTLLDGVRLTGSAPLRPGDRIRIGETVLRLLPDEAEVLGLGREASPDGPPSSITRAFATGDAAPAALAAEPAPAAVRPARDSLRTLAAIGPILAGARWGRPRAALEAALARAIAGLGGARAVLVGGDGRVALAAAGDRPPAVPPEARSAAGGRALVLAGPAGPGSAVPAGALALPVPSPGGRPPRLVYVEGPPAPDPEGWAALASLLGPVVAALEDVASAAVREGGGLFPAPVFVAESEAMRRVVALVRRAAPERAPVLVTGESGTGKELVARALHDGSPRARGPFVAVNAAALPETLLESELFGHERGAFTGAVARRKGLFELAAAGTLFLDEVGELAAATQAKLLRVLETGDFRRVGGVEALRADVRLLAATNRDLRALVAEGRFREDLLYRLAVVEVALPPLRERPEDLEPLARALLERLARERGGCPAALEPDALERLRRHAFPGNVRELRNALERALILGDGRRIRAADLPLPAPAPDAGPASGLAPLADVERRHIASVLASTGWNKKRAAEVLGIDRKTLYARIEAYGLEPAPPAPKGGGGAP